MTAVNPSIIVVLGIQCDLVTLTYISGSSDLGIKFIHLYLQYIIFFLAVTAVNPSIIVVLGILFEQAL